MPDKLTDLAVTVPTPTGWAPYQNTNLAPGTRVIAKGDTYPTAMLMVFKLNGDFDVNEAVKHGYADAELSENFKRLNASNDNFRGFPSSMIEGSYDLNGRRMHSYNRIVFATGAAQKPNVAGQAAPPVSAIWSSSRSPATRTRPRRRRPTSRPSSAGSTSRRSSRGTALMWQP